MTIPCWLAGLLAMFGIGCGFRDTVVNGVPNLAPAYPGSSARLWRMGQPTDGAAWSYVAQTVAPDNRRVTVVKLNDEADGSDEPAMLRNAWNVVKIPIPPKDDQPLTVFVQPSVYDVKRILDTIADAYTRGDTVIWHCTAGRDRTSIISGLLGMRLFGWSKERAWDDMVSHGYRWELPDLDLFFAKVGGR